MKRLWYENRFNPKKKGFIYDFGNYAEYFTENMKSSYKTFNSRTSNGR